MENHDVIVDGHTWVSCVKVWHINKLIEKDPGQTPEQLYQKMVEWTRLKLERKGNKRYWDRLDHLTNNKKTYIEAIKKVREGHGLQRV